MNPFKRLFDFIGNPSHSRTISILALLIIALAIPLTVNIAQKQQELRQRAAFEGGSGGGANITGTTECEQHESYCDNGKCAKFISRCLADTDLPSNCINQGQDCTPAGGQTSHFYQCSELQPYSCATPSAPPTKPACSGTCYPNPDAAARAGATTPITGSCSVGQCYATPAVTCESQGGGCYDSPLQAPAGWTQKAGGCSTGFCYTPGGTGEACKTDAVSAVGCNVGCVTQGGKNMKCHVQNRDASGQCSASCTTGGPWNCAEDASCGTSGGRPSCGTNNEGICLTTQECSGISGTQISGNCISGACCKPSGSGGGTSGGGTGGTPISVPTSVPTSSPSSCNSNQGYVSSCQGIASGTTKNNPSPCTQSNGQPGYSSMQCQGSCWYDSYYDTSPAKAPQSQWCYPIGVKLAFTVGLDGIGSTGDQQNPNSNPISNQSRGSNKSPKQKQRSITVEAIASDGSKTSANGTITYNSSTGKYDASVTFDKLAQGVYTFKVKGDIYLKKTIATTISVSSGQTVTLPAVNLVTGDIDKDNRLSVEDYNFFSPENCLFKSATGVCASADLDDDGGVVDQFDYNLFLREIFVIQNGD